MQLHIPDGSYLKKIVRFDVISKLVKYTLFW
mgnify:CR=1 FL=1